MLEENKKKYDKRGNKKLKFSGLDIFNWENGGF